MILVLTTLLHSLATIPPLTSDHSFRYAYSSHVIAATILSSLWHWKDQPNSALMYLNYSFAVVWFIYDMGMMRPLSDVEKVKIVAANIFILCLYDICSADQNYAVYHSLWHIASTIKCAYVSYKIFV